MKLTPPPPYLFGSSFYSFNFKVLHINIVAQYGPDFLAFCYAIRYNVNWPLKVRFPK